MDTDRVRSILAIIVVGGVVVVAAIVALLPHVMVRQDPAELTVTLEKFGSLFSGIVGTIIGYYFGKQ